MAVFSFIRRARQQAKEHNAKIAEAQAREKEKPTYKHVPTHARIDAMTNAAPPSWRYDENNMNRIVEENLKRSGMDQVPPVPPIPLSLTAPRISSGLSQVSYPSDSADPVVPIPRPFHYSADGKVVWQEQGGNGDAIYSVPDPVRMPPRMRLSMPEAARHRFVTQLPSPTESLSESTSSQEDLDMKPGPSSRRMRHSLPTQPLGIHPAQGLIIDTSPAQPQPPEQSAHRLHPSRRSLDRSSLDRGSPTSGPRRNSLPGFSPTSIPKPALVTFGIPDPSIPPMPPLPAIIPDGYISLKGSRNAPSSSESSSSASGSVSSMTPASSISTPPQIETPEPIKMDFVATGIETPVVVDHGFEFAFEPIPSKDKGKAPDYGQWEETGEEIDEETILPAQALGSPGIDDREFEFVVTRPEPQSPRMEAITAVASTVIVKRAKVSTISTVGAPQLLSAEPKSLASSAPYKLLPESQRQQEPMVAHVTVVTKPKAASATAVAVPASSAKKTPGRLQKRRR